ncbi:MAG TPA: cyclic nucleotide-binding domain-containing protein [Acidimicrobiia bacterium]|nr:cyclic nucleotide-binding domain-containing protein [Acidimicrobiia bacterium]
MALKKNAKLELLKGVPLFSGFSGKELAEVAKAADEVEYAEGRMLGWQDAAGHEAFVVVSGSITVRRNGRKVATLGAGDVAGEMALLDGDVRSADLIAAEDTRVLVIPRREFTGLVDSNPRLAGKLLATLASRLREADKKVYG